MTVSAKNNKGDSIKVTHIWAWILAVFALPIISAGVTVYVQGAVFGEKIASIERAQSKGDDRYERLDDRLRTIENQLGRVLQKLESIR